jgi:uncharacterized protein (DUF1697 family)
MLTGDPWRVIGRWDDSSMTRYIALLRGINLGPSRRMAMPRLRELLTEAGYEDVATYVQSGNVVLSAADPPDLVRERIEQLVEDEFGFHSDVVIRTREEIGRAHV